MLEALSHETLLTTLAEISAAVVGFSMVVSVLRPDSGNRAERWFTLRDVAEIGLISAAASIIPLAVHAYGGAANTTWRIASGLFAVLWISGMSLAIRRRLPHFKVVLTKGPVSVAVWLLLFVMMGLLGSNLAHPSSDSGARYVTAVTLGLAVAGLTFLWAAFDADRE